MVALAAKRPAAVMLSSVSFGFSSLYRPVCPSHSHAISNGGCQSVDPPPSIEYAISWTAATASESEYCPRPFVCGPCMSR